MRLRNHERLGRNVGSGVGEWKENFDMVLESAFRPGWLRNTECGQVQS